MTSNRAKEIEPLRSVEPMFNDADIRADILNSSSNVQQILNIRLSRIRMLSILFSYF